MLLLLFDKNNKKIVESESIEICQKTNRLNPTVLTLSLFQECTGSICLAYGLESCQCIPGPTDPPTKACELCCRLPGENQPCLLVSEFSVFYEFVKVHQHYAVDSFSRFFTFFFLCSYSDLAALHSIGISGRTTYPTCSRSRVHRVMTTTGIAMYSKSAER